jgi:alpha-1,3-rhamnosyl/mannosyltransferase
MDFGAAMQRLSADEGWHKALREAGLKHTARFSWEKCARETLAVYRSLI